MLVMVVTMSSTGPPSSLPTTLSRMVRRPEQEPSAPWLRDCRVASRALRAARADSREAMAALTTAAGEAVVLPGAEGSEEVATEGKSVEVPDAVECLEVPATELETWGPGDVGTLVAVDVIVPKLIVPVEASADVLPRLARAMFTSSILAIAAFKFSV